MGNVGDSLAQIRSQMEEHKTLQKEFEKRQVRKETRNELHVRATISDRQYFSLYRRPC